MQWRAAEDWERDVFLRRKRADEVRAAGLLLAIALLFAGALCVAGAMLFGLLLKDVQTPLGTPADFGPGLAALLVGALLARHLCKLARACRAARRARWYAAGGVCEDLDREEEYHRDRSQDDRRLYRKEESHYIIIRSDCGRRIVKRIPAHIYSAERIGRRVTMGTRNPDKTDPEVIHIHPTGAQ